MENVGIIDKSVFIEVFEKIAQYKEQVEQINRKVFKDKTQKKGFISKEECSYAQWYVWKYSVWVWDVEIIGSACDAGIISKQEYNIWITNSFCDDLWLQVGSLLKDDVQSLYIKHETARLLRKVQKHLKELEENQCV